MPQISSNGRRLYSLHGWSDSDIQYVVDNADDFLESHEDAWIIATAVAPDGVLWIYPTSGTNRFPLSLWRKIRQLILDNEHVVIPMNKNTDKVADAAKRYNGYISDNLVLFGDKLKGIKIYEGKKRWSHSTNSTENLKHL